MNFDYLKGQDDGVWHEIFEQNPYNVLPENVKGANVLDVGGHYGFFTTLVHSMGAKRIVAAEANPMNFVRYAQNTAKLDNIKAINAAVTANTGDKITINNDSGHSTVGQGDTTISTIAFADLVKFFPDNEDIVLKMDIEGAEYPIFNGTHPSVFRRFSHIFIEAHGKDIDNLCGYIHGVLGFDGAFKFTFWNDKQILTDVAVFKFVRRELRQ